MQPCRGQETSSVSRRGRPSNYRLRHGRGKYIFEVFILSNISNVVASVVSADGCDAEFNSKLIIILLEHLNWNMNITKSTVT